MLVCWLVLYYIHVELPQTKSGHLIVLEVY